MKEYSEACDQNRAHILGVIRDVFGSARQVLEIGSGTGQHAIYFGRHLPHLQWQTSDLPASHASINAWISEADLPNVHAPFALDVANGPWPDVTYDGIFSANTTHIMSWPMVESLFAGVAPTLAPGASFCLYGPFNYNNTYTSPSNERFDAWLKNRNPDSGIRNFQDLDALAMKHGLHLSADNEMPANNRLLVWTRQE